jgi:hypothetical protein
VLAVVVGVVVVVAGLLVVVVVVLVVVLLVVAVLLFDAVSELLQAANRKAQHTDKIRGKILFNKLILLKSQLM